MRDSLGSRGRLGRRRFRGLTAGGTVGRAEGQVPAGGRVEARDHDAVGPRTVWDQSLALIRAATSLSPINGVASAVFCAMD